MMSLEKDYILVLLILLFQLNVFSASNGTTFTTVGDKNITLHLNKTSLWSHRALEKDLINTGSGTLGESAEFNYSESSKSPSLNSIPLISSIRHFKSRKIFTRTHLLSQSPKKSDNFEYNEDYMGDEGEKVTRKNRKRSTTASSIIYGSEKKPRNSSKNSSKNKLGQVFTLLKNQNVSQIEKEAQKSDIYTNNEEIPLVYIPGSVPNFSENLENSHENGEKLEEIENGGKNETNKSDMDIVTKFLRIVEEKSADDCAAGTDLTLGQGVVDRYAQKRFQLEAEVAVNRANMLTRLWKYAPEVMGNEYLLHASLFSMVEFDDDIFAAGNCYDKLQYKNYELFCPFAYRLPEGTILVKDLAVEYKYLSNTSEFFYVARKNAERVIKNFNQFTKGYNSYTYNESTHTEREEEVILNVTYEDGKWSKPYFDCGGGNIWMMTYTVPFFDFKNNTYFFKGTSGIDIDLRRVDIDQCPLPSNSTELNIFAASDKCKNSTTKCVPISGLGFRRGSYRCYCKDGFYFPNVTSPLKFFNGSLLEEEYENKFMGRVSRYDEIGAFECLLCPYGCDTCEDDRPCVVSLNWLMRSAILILQSVIILMLPIVGLFTWKYSEVKVVRAASPVLLRFIVLGAFFIYCTILVMYPSPSVITCTLRVWLREIGFSLAYGALMLKTWRISVIFRVRSAKAVKITDLDLMKRLGIIVGMFTALLVIRTLVAPPVSIVSLTADDLKAWLCKSDWWDHSFTIMELSFLVWGIRLCIVVRKAPSEFNESKFISLAIYNEFLLSLFLNISMLFLQSPANPDLLYIIFFCHVQLTMTLLLCLIFGSKAYMVFRGHGKGSGSDETKGQNSKFIGGKSRSGGQTKQGSISAGNNSTAPCPPLQSSIISSGILLDSTSTLLKAVPDDLHDEFRRLSSHLEELKERNIKLGKHELVSKIIAMQEAAETILTQEKKNSSKSPSPHLLTLKIDQNHKTNEVQPSKTQNLPNSLIVHEIPGQVEPLGEIPICDKKDLDEKSDSKIQKEKEIEEIPISQNDSNKEISENIDENICKNKAKEECVEEKNHKEKKRKPSGGNMILDLDDKSRFTEEIAV